MKDVQIVLVSEIGYKSLLYSLFHSAAGLVLVGAVGKTAVVKHLPHLGEEMRHFLFLEIHHAELLDAGGVDDKSVTERK